MSEQQEIIKSLILELADHIKKTKKPSVVAESIKEEINFKIDPQESRNFDKEKNKRVSEVGNIKMGIGEAGRFDNTFPRAFRFILKSETLPEIEYYTSDVQIDYTKGILDISIMEVINPDCDFAQKLHDWIYKLEAEKIKDKLNLTTLDGCGRPLYEIHFEDFKVLEHNMTKLDYASSDVIKQKVKLSFEKTDRNSLIQKKEK